VIGDRRFAGYRASFSDTDPGHQTNRIFGGNFASGKAQTRRDEATRLQRLRRAEVFALPITGAYDPK
jgi:hypothetical protein